MSEKKKKAVEASRSEAELMDQILAGCQDAEDVFGPGGAFNQLRKRLIERMLHTELSCHLGYEKGQRPPEAVAAEGNHRNGYSSKKVISEDGPMDLAILRDRLGKPAAWLARIAMPTSSKAMSINWPAPVRCRTSMAARMALQA